MSRSAAEGLADGVAAHARQHQVQHHQVDLARRFLQQLHRRWAVAHGGDAVSFRHQVVLDAGGQMLFVLDDQYVFVGGHDRGQGPGARESEPPGLSRRGHYDVPSPSGRARVRAVSQEMSFL